MTTKLVPHTATTASASSACHGGRRAPRLTSRPHAAHDVVAALRLGLVQRALGALQRLRHGLAGVVFGQARPTA